MIDCSCFALKGAVGSAERRNAAKNAIVDRGKPEDAKRQVWHLHQQLAPLGGFRAWENIAPSREDEFLVAQFCANHYQD